MEPVSSGLWVSLMEGRRGEGGRRKEGREGKGERVCVC